MKALSGMLEEELSAILEGEPPFRARQLFEWVQKGAESFEEMTTLPKTLRQRLEEGDPALRSSDLDLIAEDPDGSVKFRIGLADGGYIESVLMHDEQDRKTLCLSSQLGCSMGCTFCKTGTLGLKRNLDAGEIVEQYMITRRWLEEGADRASGKSVEASGDRQTPETGEHLIDNIVFMGMGEPLANTEEVIKAIRILTHPKGAGLSPRRITVSTSGLVQEIEKLIALQQEDPAESRKSVRGIKLAVSLVSAVQSTRDELMPALSGQSLVQLQSVLIEYQKLVNKRITLEIVLLQGINDGKDEIQALVEFLEPLNAFVNVIPWNPVSGLPFTSPSRDRLQSYLSNLEQAGITTATRRSRGRGVNAACGQLGAGPTDTAGGAGGSAGETAASPPEGRDETAESGSAESGKRYRWTIRL